MGNYVKITDFAVKDSLLTGNPLKLITGTAHDNEYNAIAVAVATKIDSGGALNTPSSGTLTNCTGLPVSTGVSGLGTGVATALAVNVGSAGSPVVNGGALGTPSSGTLTSCTGLPQAGTVGLTTTDSPEFAGVNVGHASDTTITRVSAGTVAIEGVNVLTTATGAALAGSATQVFSAAAPTSAANVQRWDTPDMASITVTQAAGALTFAGVAHPLTFRSATLTDGTVFPIIADPADLVLPSGGTLGFTSGVQGRIVVAEMHNSGVSEYAICNQAGGLQTDERNLISTTAIDTASDASNVWYSTTARTNLPYKIVHEVDVVNTAGAWGNPILVQPAGGNAQLKSVSMVRVHTANGYGSTNTMIRRFTTVVSDIGDDITYADSAANGASFTINTADFYTVSFTDTFDAAQTVGISKNSTQLTTAIGAITAADRLCSQDTHGSGYVANCATRVWCDVGDIIRPHTTGQASGAGAASTNFTITRG